MTATRHEPISQFVQALDVETRHGDVQIRATDDLDGEIAASENVECHLEGDRLVVRPIRHHADLEIRLPASVRHVSVVTGAGDLTVDCEVDELRARTGRGDVELRGAGRADVDSGHGDVEIGAWNGPLRVSTGAGDVSAREIGGALEVRTGRGDVDVREAPAGGHIQTGNGDVRLERAGGDCAVHTGNGDVEAHDLQVAKLTVHTGHGDVGISGSLSGLRVSGGHGGVALRAALLAGDFAIELAHGDISVELPSDSDVRVEAVTGHGRVETNLPLVRVGRPGPAGEFAQRFVGSVGSQSPPAALRIRTNRGRVRIVGAFGGAESPREWAEPQARPTEPRLSATERAWAETMRAFGSSESSATAATPTPEPQAQPTPAPAEPTTPPTRDDLAILEAVSRGEISVDEALALLGR